MNRLAAVSVILVQFWLLSPMCCCWFKAASKADGKPCCCADTDEGASSPAAPAKDTNCRCSDNKIELPPAQNVAIADPTKQLHPFGQLVTALTQQTAVVVCDDLGPLDFRDRPPPLAGPDRLYELHRLTL